MSARRLPHSTAIVKDSGAPGAHAKNSQSSTVVVSTEPRFRFGAIRTSAESVKPLPIATASKNGASASVVTSYSVTLTRGPPTWSPSMLTRSSAAETATARHWTPATAVVGQSVRSAEPARPVKRSTKVSAASADTGAALDTSPAAATITDTTTRLMSELLSGPTAEPRLERPAEPPRTGRDPVAVADATNAGARHDAGLRRHVPRNAPARRSRARYVALDTAPTATRPPVANPSISHRTGRS
jgi:hypothetical protein